MMTLELARLRVQEAEQAATRYRADQAPPRRPGLLSRLRRPAT